MRAPLYRTRLIMPVGTVQSRRGHGVWVSRMRLIRAGLSMSTLRGGRSVGRACVEGQGCHSIHYRNLGGSRSALGWHRTVLSKSARKLEDVSCVVIVIGGVVDQALTSIARLLAQMISDRRLWREEVLIIVIGLRTGVVAGNVVAVDRGRGLLKRRERAIETGRLCRGGPGRGCRRCSAGWTRLVPVTSNRSP